MSQKILLTSQEVNIILHRLACQLIEKHLDFSETILIGIQPRGTFLAERLKTLLEKEYKITNILLGYLDITFFRDDFRRNDKQLEANKTQIDFLVDLISDAWANSDVFHTRGVFIDIQIHFANNCNIICNRNG